ncbi:glycosyltransferase family 4 protein [Morganella morganii]|uniref:glycosyltransferase family 4 protein n=1 Tax=Morganella morganii TaxID=582 RepID=UPI0021D30761|nr:glycosyltransferase family 4 protein [Morganella morganii]MCU6375768.1 glycosyltransferase family 4 protein [Morganella morganii]HEI9845846.1 glycosyltransferase family 4 protein [Morganella morganii]
MKPSSIAHIQVIPKLSGAQLFSLEILKNTNINERYIICSSSETTDKNQKNEFIRQFENIGVKIIWVKYLKRNIGIHDILAFWELYSICKKYKFDIVHTNSTKPGFIARISARIAGIKKIIHTVHGISFHRNCTLIVRLFFYMIEIISLQFGHYNITVNKYYLKYYRICPWKKSYSIYNGVDFKKLNTIESKPKDLNTFKILFVGRLDKQKDPLSLIHAVSLCYKKYKNISLDIIGDGYLFKECIELIKELNLTDIINIRGWCNTPSIYYQSSDIFISPSIFEAFGFTLTEAAYYKLPIIATNVEGIPEVVKDKKMGFLVNPRDINEIAEKIIYFIENPKILKEMGEYGHYYVTNNFPIAKMVRKYNMLYRKD